MYQVLHFNDLLTIERCKLDWRVQFSKNLVLILCNFVPDPVKLKRFMLSVWASVAQIDFWRRWSIFTASRHVRSPPTHFLIGCATVYCKASKTFTFPFSVSLLKWCKTFLQFVERAIKAFLGAGFANIRESNWFWYFNSPFACHIEMGCGYGFCMYQNLEFLVRSNGCR